MTNPQVSPNNLGIFPNPFAIHVGKTPTWLALMLTLSCMISTANLAQARPHSGTIYKTAGSDLTVSQYELALVQVLAEICPPMLNPDQRLLFIKAYDQQLRSFLPTADNPNDTLKLLHSQRDYRTALQNVRAWTASYPINQNRRLCLQFSEISI